MTTTTRQILHRRRKGELEIDIIEEILTRLPAKHILRCKLLSKTCYDLIRKPSFINKHIINHCSRSINHSIVVVHKDPYSSESERMISPLSGSLVFLPPRTPSYGWNFIVGSCNGLLVLQLFHVTERQLTLVNPATREYKLLPIPKLENMSGIYYDDALGFGYDATSGDYKMLKMGDYSGESNYICEMWSMSTNTWKQISVPTPNLLWKEYVLTPNHGLLVGGSLHWLAYTRKASERVAFILSFDLCDDTFSQIALPNNVGKYDLLLIDLMGSLALSIELPYGDSRRLFDIWVMDSDFSWTKRFSIGPFPPHTWTTTQVCMNGKFLLQRFSHSHIKSSKFILYDPKSKKQQELPVDELHTIGVAWSFTESLVPIPA